MASEDGLAIGQYTNPMNKMHQLVQDGADDEREEDVGSHEEKNSTRRPLRDARREETMARLTRRRWDMDS